MGLFWLPRNDTPIELVRCAIGNLIILEDYLKMDYPSPPYYLLGFAINAIDKLCTQRYPTDKPPILINKRIYPTSMDYRLCNKGVYSILTHDELIALRECINAVLEEKQDEILD